LIQNRYNCPFDCLFWIKAWCNYRYYLRHF